MNSEMKVVKFGGEDVIATSGVTFKFSGIGDGNKANNTFAGVTQPNATSFTAMNTAVSSALGVQNAGVTSNTYVYGVSDSVYRLKLSGIFGTNNTGDTKYSELNTGSFEYKNGAFYRI